MKIIRAEQCRSMPWKNGGGETTEIAVGPDGAGLENFAWRLSAARVSRDGPFSPFPGVDRTLAVLAGEGLELETAGAKVRLTPADAPFSFPGDQPTQGRLLGSPVDDLNIMTRRNIARHGMRRLRVEGSLCLASDAAILLLFCAEGAISLERDTLRPRDTALLMDNRDGHVLVGGQGSLYAIEIDAHPSLR